MASSLAGVVVSAPLVTREPLHLSPAKANLTHREVRAQIGSALKRAIDAAHLSIKEAAAELQIDAAQLSRQIAGSEPVQVDRLYGSRLHGLFAIELASAAEGVIVDVTVTIRRTA
jgi:hypothetical protein